MDTRQKNRPAAAGSRSRSAEQNKKRRSGSTPQRRRTDASRSATGTARRSAAPARRSSTAAAGTRRTAPRTAPAEQKPEQVARPVRSDAPEMVFKPGETTARRTRTPEEHTRSARRRRSAKRSAERKKDAERAKNRPAVTYTQPKPLNWNRLLLQLAIVIAVVLAVVMGLSVFFKVDQVVVYGNNAYTAWMVQEAAGIEGGENLLTFGNTRACGKIKAGLPYVETVRIGIKLPDTVNIYITEYDVAYAITSADETWWLMTSDGKMVEQIDAGTAGNYTKVLGVQVDRPQVGEPAMAVEASTVVNETVAEGETAETTPVLITGAARLNAALQILSALELNDIVGEAASVDVTSLSNIELWYGQQYQVKLGDTNNLEQKIADMRTAINQLNDYDMGILDVSYTTFGEQVGFTAFE